MFGRSALTTLVLLAASAVTGNSAPGALAAATIHVPADQPTIQAAINAASDGDTVLVLPGTYVENVNFVGKAITVASEQGPEVTTIDGNRAGSVVTFDSGEGPTSGLVGFTLKGGLATDYFHPGGGVSIQSASPSIIGNLVTDNQSCSGAGIAIVKYAIESSPLIEGNTIVTNDASTGCEGGGVGGGGIGINGADEATVTDNVIIGNKARVSGGGIAMNGGGNSVFANNVIKGNRLTDALYGDGGGISMINQSDVLIQQNVISHNEAKRGGGISWLSPSPGRGPHLVYNTFVDNDADTGSAIFADGYDSLALVANNVIVGAAAQTALHCGDLNDLNPPMMRHNDVYSPMGTLYGGICSDQTGLSGNLSVDPLFVYPAKDNYHLRPNSPVIDVGDNASPDIPLVDFDGGSRLVDGNGDTIAVVDIGADEYDPSTDADGDGMPDGIDNCSGVINYDQADLEGDGVGDVCDPDDDDDSLADEVDNCPLVPNHLQENSDGDVIGSACDNCPGVPNSTQTESDGDLSGDACDGAGSGNVDCSALPIGVTSVDALKVLRHSAGLSVTQSEPCLDIGQPRALPPPDDRLMGDANCSTEVNSVDALLILRAVAGLPTNIPQGCPAIKPPL